jgi:hypothetical protein
VPGSPPGRGRTPAASRKPWLSPHTVVSHLKKMYGKTACHSRTELVPLEYSIGWLTCTVASRLETVMVG